MRSILVTLVCCSLLMGVVLASTAVDHDLGLQDPSIDASFVDATSIVARRRHHGHRGAKVSLKLSPKGASLKLSAKVGGKLAGKLKGIAGKLKGKVKGIKGKIKGIKNKLKGKLAGIKGKLAGLKAKALAGAQALLAKGKDALKKLGGKLKLKGVNPKKIKKALKKAARRAARKAKKLAKRLKRQARRQAKRLKRKARRAKAKARRARKALTRKLHKAKRKAKALAKSAADKLKKLRDALRRARRKHVRRLKKLLKKNKHIRKRLHTIRRHKKRKGKKKVKKHRAGQPDNYIKHLKSNARAWRRRIRRLKKAIADAKPTRRKSKVIVSKIPHTIDAEMAARNKKLWTEVSIDHFMPKTTVDLKSSTFNAAHDALSKIDPVREIVRDQLEDTKGQPLIPYRLTSSAERVEAADKD